MPHKHVVSGYRRRFSAGAELVKDQGVHFRVWAPERQSVIAVIANDDGSETLCTLEPDGQGYFEGLAPDVRAGARYRYLLDEEGPFPDPVSRFQPGGPHGPSQVVDPDAFVWSDHAWTGPALEGAVFYEMHIGTFTKEGTWDAAREHLASLARLGVTVLEVMPVADFAGQFGWSYDGVNLYAPTRLYGDSDSMRRFVDRAHAEGIGVILDVVYNHLGPDGNVLPRYAEAYFSNRHDTEWGKALNFDGDNSAPVRSFILDNAAYWISEYHIDGLRLDATQSLFDDSDDHIIAAIARRVREAAGPGRQTLIVGENEPQDVRLIQPTDQGGYGLDAVWVDDFHHSAMVAATGRHEGYYAEYRGTPQEFVSVCRKGFLWQGQYNARQKKRRGTPTAGIDRSRFIFMLQNHDQIGNSARGERIDRLTSPGEYRALTALLLLGSGTPFLFQGQEFAASSPFLYFGDLAPEIAELTYTGRKQSFEQFASLATQEMQDRVPRPNDPETFTCCRLDHAERQRNVEAYTLHLDLLRLRREYPPLFRGTVDGVTLGERAFLLRFSAKRESDLLLVVNLGPDIVIDPPIEPLLAPPSDQSDWELIWSSEDPRYGGGGVAPVAVTGANAWRFPGRSATLFGSGSWEGQK